MQPIDLIADTVTADPDQCIRRGRGKISRAMGEVAEYSVLPPMRGVVLMRGAKKKAAKRWALSVAGIFAFQAALADMPTGSVEGRRVPTGKILVQAAPAPAATGQAAQSPGVTAAQPPQAPIEEVEARITDLHRRLLITPRQEPEFKAYADVMRANAQTMQALFQERAKETDMSAVARLRWVARLTQVHADNLNKLVPVFEVLYQSLSDQQKKAADTVFEEIRQRRAARRAQ